MSGFFSFNKKNFINQDNDNWCWCACFEWIIETFQIHTPFNLQWKILFYHEKFLTNARSEDLRFTENFIMSDKFDNPLQIRKVNFLIEQLLPTFEYHFDFIENISAQERERYFQNKLSYENVKNELTKNKAPFLVFGKSHMYLINGFGKQNECEFLLRSDPLTSVPVKYIQDKELIINESIDIRGIWTLINKNSSVGVVPDLNMKELNLRFSKLVSYSSEFPISKTLVNNFTNILDLSRKINNQLLQHKNNNSTELKYLITNVIKNYNPRLINCLPILETDYNKDKVDNTFNILKSYLESNGRDIILDKLIIPSGYREDITHPILIDENDNLGILINGEKIRYIEGITKLNKY